MKPRTLLLVVLALVCGVSAAVGVNQLNRPKDTTASPDTGTVVLAKTDIPRGGVLTAENCTVGEWPKNLLPSGAITKLEDAVDRSVMVPMVKGEPVLEGKIADKQAGRGLASMVRLGMRAFTIQTPHVAAGVGGFIMPDNRVDVLLTTRGHGINDGTGGGATTTLLQNVEVLAVDRRLDKEEDGEAELTEPKSVTLLVTPDQAAKLDLGMNMGTLHLSLRNPEDDAEANTRPATLAQLRFHQEKPLSNLADRAGKLAGAMARIIANSSNDSTEETAETQLAPVQHRTANIRTLRGSSRGNIRIDASR